jgi:hypothetical protein
MKWQGNYIHKLKNMWKVTALSYFKTLSNIYLEGLKKSVIQYGWIRNGILIKGILTVIQKS